MYSCWREGSANGRTQTFAAYYSLSGTTRAVAVAVAEELDAGVEEIGCSRLAVHQKRCTLEQALVMSALPPKADILG